MFIRLSTAFVMLLGLTVLVSAEAPVPRGTYRPRDLENEPPGNYCAGLGLYAEPVTRGNMGGAYKYTSQFETLGALPTVCLNLRVYRTCVKSNTGDKYLQTAQAELTE
ncbi:uncharacterized protein BJ212DRAFT_1300789 [Suillus subaureus]|uniref:Uncharacterized protein n=1 Tax=Suillus subaureus TaxID=48587 RepID=A0A9P7JBT8_9AGAM|nr:uncharacterized protein BJ212DRAFT_1300789 [Suillus subaureus]KAG1813905.1 hypothetical protein BJ212DRAFT_1300789 [Suillus subaureus]